MRDDELLDQSFNHNFLWNAYSKLLGSSTTARLWIGIPMFLTGIVGTWLLWEEGWIWGLTIFFSIAGFFVTLDGTLAFIRERKVRELFAQVKSRRNEILRQMLKEKQAGRSPLRWLNAQKIREPKIREWLLEELKSFD